MMRLYLLEVSDAVKDTFEGFLGEEVTLREVDVCGVCGALTEAGYSGHDHQYTGS